ncbi:MAG: tetratricopeptide repeat protein [Pyrinomonadaceae bacterium]|nr:tetratricopeptide repeat protein [Pyrinomonadaceae bacterium]
MQNYKRQEELARQYFKEDDKCRDLVRGQKWKEAEESCKVIVLIADQLSDDRSLERMGAYELFDHVLRGQKRYEEALEYYNCALDAARSRLTEKNAELGRLYGDMAITHHLVRDLGKARELYKEAEKIYQLAHASIGDGDSDEWVVGTKQEYIRVLPNERTHNLAADFQVLALKAWPVTRRLVVTGPPPRPTHVPAARYLKARTLRRKE